MLMHIPFSLHLLDHGGLLVAKEPTSTRVASTGTMLAFALGDMAGNTLYQAFALLVFVFYYAVVGINVIWMMWGYGLWAVWNAINDPLAGYLSDRTRTRWGRRRPWIWTTVVPLCVVMVLLFMPPLGDQWISFLYFMVVVIAFDGLYTVLVLNQTSLFPEMFITEESRTRTARVRSIFTIIGLIIAYVGTTFLISDMTTDLVGYQKAGLLVAVISFILFLVCIKWGLFEKAEFKHDVDSNPRGFTALIDTFRSRPFWPYLGAAFCTWFVFGMLPTVIGLYVKFVLGAGDALTVGLLLLVAFLVAAAATFLWKAIGRRYGLRAGYAASMGVWIITLLPFFFISDVTQGFIAMFFMGFGLAGPIFFIDLLISQVIDDDEIRTGVRREGAYFGTNALFIRLPLILQFLAIGLVFAGTGWSNYTPLPGVDTIFGLRLLVAGLPIIALALAILCISRYPLHGARLAENERRLAEIHEKKIARAKKAD
jgi:GPH family glycoside/pentoside/hexuronide:cation symporter